MVPSQVPLEIPPRYNPKSNGRLSFPNLPHGPPLVEDNQNSLTNIEEDEVLKEVKKADKKEEQISDRKLKELVNSAYQPLYRLSSVFPFDFFPDHITIELSQINIVINQFLSDRRQSIAYEDIYDVYVDNSLFFSTIKILDKHFRDNELKINFLKKEEATKARRIIQGLVIAHKEKIDLTNMNQEEVIKKIEDLGKIHGIE